MIVNEEKYIKSGVGIVLLTLVVAFIVIGFFGATLRPANLPYEFVILIELLCGAIVGLSLGLLVGEETRIYGFIYLSIFILLPIITIIMGLITGSPVSMDVLFQWYGIGALIGLILSCLFLALGKMNYIIPVLKGVFIILTGSIAVIISVFSLLIPLFSSGNPGVLIGQFDFWVSVIALVLVILTCVLACVLTINIRGSNVFVIGPAGSGKTVLGIGLWDAFMGGAEKQNILLKKGRYEEIYNGSLSVKGNANDITLESLHDRLCTESKYSAIANTTPGDLSMFKVKKMILGFIPITWTIMDYAGEFYDNLTIEHYYKAVGTVLHELNATPIADKDGKGRGEAWTGKTLYKAACSGELIDVVKASRFTQYRSNTGEFRTALSIVISYSNYLNSGKTIFLVDGDQVIKRFRVKESKLVRKRFGNDTRWVDSIISKYETDILQENKSYQKVFTDYDVQEIRDILKDDNAFVSSDAPSFKESADDDDWDDILNDSPSEVPEPVQIPVSNYRMQILQTIVNNYSSSGESKKSLGAVWQTYGDILKELKRLRIRKKIAVCVTKLDKVCLHHTSLQKELKEIYKIQQPSLNHNDTGSIPLSLIVRDADVEQRLNKKLYDELKSTDGAHFTKLFGNYYAASTTPMYFTGICIDGRSPDGIHVAVNEDNALYPWGFDELLTFGTIGHFPFCSRIIKPIILKMLMFIKSMFQNIIGKLRRK